MFGGGLLNLYSYVNSDPVNFIDPTGLKVGDWWDIPANYKRAREIAREEYNKRPNDHNNAGDAMRHAEWSRRMTQEINNSTSFCAGVGHEIEGLLGGSPLGETFMDLHNNYQGRKAGRGNKAVDPKDLVTSPGGRTRYGL